MYLHTKKMNLISKGFQKLRSIRRVTYTHTHRQMQASAWTRFICGWYNGRSHQCIWIFIFTTTNINWHPSWCGPPPRKGVKGAHSSDRPYISVKGPHGSKMAQCR